MKQKLEQILTTSSDKHYSKIIKKDEALVAWIMEQTKNLSTEVALIERVYVVISGDNPICPRGNKKKFNTINKGYRFCAQHCQCQRENQSNKIEKVYHSKSKEDQEAIFAKMRQTNLKRYGVENAALAEEIKNKIKDTCMERYGAASPLESEVVQAKVKQTCMDRYGVEYTFQNTDIHRKSLETTIERYGGLMIHARKGANQKYDGNPFAHPEIKQKLKTPC